LSATLTGPVAVRWRAVAFLFLTVLAAVARAQSPAPAGVQTSLLHELFQDHAVLQREQPIAVWGRAANGETVTVALGTSTVRAQADASGRWSTQLPAMAAGGPYELTAQGSSGARQAVQDILLGDVFLCSGQSNMEMQVLRASNSYDEIRKSANNTIRLASIHQAINPAPLTHFQNPVGWQVASPETVPDWSAVCFFFARELQSFAHVPIGLIQSTWGGANIRPWISAGALQALGGYESGLRLLGLYAQDPAAAQNQFAHLWEQWWRAGSGDRPGSEPWIARRLPQEPKQGSGPAQSPGRESAALTKEPAEQWRSAPGGLGDWRTWGDTALADFTGALWYRTRINLTPAQALIAASGGAKLSLGAINQVDETWMNGRALGNTFGYETDRTYEIPRGRLHAGENVLVVNVATTYGPGGLLAKGERRALHLPGGESIPLTGVWEYRVVPGAVGTQPRAPWESVGGLSTMYNAMIAPLGGYGLRAALWYQGESNSSEPQSYRSLLETLMADWRRQFGRDLPFLIVQLPNYGALPTAPTESGWAELREAQRLAVAHDAHAGLAVTVDIGDPHNLHPTNKQDVARRLANAARHVIFGESTPPSGPAPVSATRDSNGIVVDFTDVEGGLVAYSHATPIAFELCDDAPHSCRFASAQIEGSRVVLPVPTGSSPTRVRYCWADSPVCTLADAAGLPAVPFELRVVSPPVHLSSEQDHARIMKLLRIDSLRRGPDGDSQSPNAANFDESRVSPNLRLPDPLVLNDGRRVKTSDVWWKQRRAEIAAAFDSEVYGRVPRDVPKVIWRVTRTDRESVGGVPVITKQITGHVDSSAYPLINVDIALTLTTPARAAGPVPVIMEFGLSPDALAALRKRFTAAQWATFMGTGPSWQSQVLAKGWGYAVLIPTSIQADSGEGLTQGVIGLTNEGQPRKLDDWGALRAWAWGASRALDYFETDPHVDARQVGIEGLSRYGKAALVAMAYEPRFAIAFVGSSGEGGAKISRRNFGEQVENLASSAEYHWMAGNFLEYAGPRTVADLPVDAHELIALCAPRPVFVSSGSQSVEGGWVDAKGMFLGAVGAGPVYKLLGGKDLGTSVFPPMETALIDGDIAFRQHSGGHTDGPNWPAFLTFANRYIKGS
jgi:sialate O-acetylesterase